MVFETILMRGCILVLILSGVPLLATVVSGLIVSVLQAVTQIQEQSVGMVVKLGAVLAVIMLFGRHGLALTISFVQQMLDGLHLVGGLAS